MIDEVKGVEEMSRLLEKIALAFRLINKFYDLETFEPIIK